MKKFYKRLAIILTLAAWLIVPGIFWLGGWNFQRNDTGIGCVIVTVIASIFTIVVPLSIGHEEEK